MEISTKAHAYDVLEELTEMDDNTQIIKYLCDFFSTSELVRLISHIKSEKGFVDEDDEVDD